MGNSINVVLREESTTILNEAIESHPTLRQYKVEAALVPGSGRVTRTYRLRHGSRVEASAVLKAAAFVEDDSTSSMLQDQQRELERIRAAVSGLSHVAPFLTWFVEPPKVVRGVRLRTVFLLRPHMYTTLSDRLACRPWLTVIEKLWITHQLLTALSDLHRTGVCHGFLTTENIGLTSLNYLTIMDLSSYKALHLRFDDPSPYLFYFQLQHDPSHLHVKRSEKRCYIAPERFSGSNTQPQPSDGTLAPAMDIFSAGCVITELFLNGERCMDLGDVIEYRNRGELPPQIQQKLAKIESSHLRAACRHMLHLDPKERVTAESYWQRLQASDLFPASFPVLSSLLERMHTQVSPDARIALAVSCYEKVLWETMGERDSAGVSYFMKALGPAAALQLNVQFSTDAPVIASSAEKQPVPVNTEPVESTISIAASRDLFAETEELLHQLNVLDASPLGDGVSNAESATDFVERANKAKADDPALRAVRSTSCQDSLLIYLQLVLSTVPHVQRPATKVVALRLIQRLAMFSGDDGRLQRIVPVAVSLLHDQDPMVRAVVLKSLTYTLSIIRSFSPSDSKVFPQFIFKAVSALVADPSLVVRVAVAQCVAQLAETALRFLDINHAVRLYEAMGGGTGIATPEDTTRKIDVDENVFTDDLARLLDAKATADSSQRSKTSDSHGHAKRLDGVRSDTGRTLISSAYTSELAALVDVVSRWVVTVATDQSEYSALPKRALLVDLNRLCSLFGTEGVMAFILPQILTFLNDRKNWELRASLFDAIPSVCHVIGRAATEEFVLPCVEIGLVDVNEAVICRALACLTSLIQVNLVSKSRLVGATASGAQSSGLLSKYAALLIHPAGEIRHEAVEAYAAAIDKLGSPTSDVFVLPVLLPILRYAPSVSALCKPSGLRTCLRAPLNRGMFGDELKKISSIANATDSIDGPWTSIGIDVREGSDRKEDAKVSSFPDVRAAEHNESPLAASMLGFIRPYLCMLVKHTAQPLGQKAPSLLREQLDSGFEASTKLSQSIMIPRQDGIRIEALPSWYAAARDSSGVLTSGVSESTAIQSIAVLGSVYGLSILSTAGSSTDALVTAGDDFPDTPESSGDLSLTSCESKVIESAYLGHWGAEALVAPDTVDTVLLVAKLKGLAVPPLSPSVGHSLRQVPPAALSRISLPSQSVDWRPKANALIATSSLVSGHSAPVVRLAVSTDSCFIASASYDGTCRVWNVSSLDDPTGVLETSLIYSGHSSETMRRVNDVAAIEGSSSFVSGASDGTVHVWRVETVSPTPRSITGDSARRPDKRKAIGSTSLRTIDPGEGEVLTVNHFNSLSSSVVTFSTQKGIVHSWDLRCGEEPFSMVHSPELGHLTSTVVGSDRQWIVSGTSRGYITLWDVRFQQPVKLWQHPGRSPINRLASSMVTPPQSWGSRSVSDRSRPFLFVASGQNECSMIDALTGKCVECFRTTHSDNHDVSSSRDALPDLVDISLEMKSQRNIVAVSPFQEHSIERHTSTSSQINCLVGSIGQNQSYLITGDSDSNITFWDFASPSKCYVVSGPAQAHMRPSFERLDVERHGRLMLCRMPRHAPPLGVNRLLKRELQHSDSIQDLKIVNNNLLVTCSRDKTIKVWR